MDANSADKGKSKVQVEGNSTPKHFRWSYDMECCFLNLLMHEDRLGNRVSGTFTPQAYRNILCELQGSYGNGIRKTHMQNKIRALKSNYSEFNDAFRDMSGFSWNWETKKFDAENEVCEGLIQENPKAAGLRGKCCMHWDAMNTLWASSRASGNKSSTCLNMGARLDAQVSSSPTNVPYPSSNCQNTSAYYDVSGSPGLANATSDRSMPDVSGSQPSASSGRTKSKRKSSGDEQAQTECRNLAASMRDISRSMVECASILANRAPRPHPSSADLFNALYSLDLNADYLIECYEFLFNNDVKADMFLGTNQEFRSVILNRIMNGR